jgi:inorganic pyrophosphatase
MENSEFWLALEKLVSQSVVVIDRPRGSRHPRYPEIIYAVDYGYLEGTSSADGGGIDLWRGSRQDGGIDAVICTVDLVKRDSEIKILMGCTEEEKKKILDFHNGTELMKGIMIGRHI